MNSYVEAINLSKSFGTIKAVKKISLHVEQGEVLGFLGPNGAGKSTTMRMITGYLRPSSGKVSVGGFDILENPTDAQKHIGYLPEGAPSYGEMTTVSYLNFIADVRRVPRREKKQTVENVIDKINLNTVANRKIEDLSKGYKRRVGLAQAIMHDPSVLIMDEPTDGLDPNQKHEIRTLIREMAPKKAIIISTHILEEVDTVCTSTAVIHKGRIIFSGTPSQLAALSTYHDALNIVVKIEEAEEALRILKSQQDVTKVEEIYSGNEIRITALLRAKEPASSRIQDTLTKEKIIPKEYFFEKGRLDQVFRDLTGNDETPEEEVL
ncbi:MAG: ABC transporter ATP-binding protein [Pseudomonadota bacterium]|nr:ABC transporter ATP-binding protein [Pseudomonadota bacterium]